MLIRSALVARARSRHELVLEQVVVPLERDRRDRSPGAAAQLEVVGRRRAVARLELAAARIRIGWTLSAEELLAGVGALAKSRTPFAAIVSVAHGADHGVVGVVADGELLAAGVAAPAAAYGDRYAQDLRIVDGIAYERVRLARS